MQNLISMQESINYIFEKNQKFSACPKTPFLTDKPIFVVSKIIEEVFGNSNL